MKKLLSVFAVLCFVSITVFAGPFAKFNDMLDYTTQEQAQKYLDNLASDLGNIMTGGSFSASAGLGLNGIDLHLKVNYNKVSSEIFEAEEINELYVPMLTGAVALPGNINILAKYGYMQDTNIYGAGLRYKIFEGKDLIIPSVSIQGMYTLLKADDGINKVDGNNLGLGAVATFNIPIVTPYIGVGWDKTKVNPKSSNKQDLEGSYEGFGYYAGVSVSAVIINGTVGISVYDGYVSYTIGLSSGF
ncbi:hypothetical protein [Candidatus Ruminimicrobiellum ovillum]|uniref:hypothetical protein n=1 Tax=Candidatus Ruminimicrobiellum ovillum TaxID=1947927 RepID=UPI00355A54B5